MTDKKKQGYDRSRERMRGRAAAAGRSGARRDGQGTGDRKAYQGTGGIQTGRGTDGGSAYEDTGARLADRGQADAGGGSMIEGRNAVAEAIRSGRRISRIVVLDGAHDRTLSDIAAEARRLLGIEPEYADRRQLDSLSGDGRHQGVIAYLEAYTYAEIGDILARAEKKNEPPFIFILDGIEDPHNLGAIIRTANLSGAHGVIIRQDRAAGLTAAVARASAGAVNYTPVARVTNIARTIDSLREYGLWFVCADMDGELMYDLDLTGPVGLVIGNEGSGVSRLVREKCDMTASIPMSGDIDSLNASVAAGVLAYEVVRQRIRPGR